MDLSPTNGGIPGHYRPTGWPVPCRAQSDIECLTMLTSPLLVRGETAYAWLVRLPDKIAVNAIDQTGMEHMTVFDEPQGLDPFYKVNDANDNRPIHVGLPAAL